MTCFIIVPVGTSSWFPNTHNNNDGLIHNISFGREPHIQKRMLDLLKHDRRWWQLVWRSGNSICHI